MNSEDWDYVVLQGQSQEPSFPYGQVNSQTLPFAMQLADSAQTISTCSQAMFFMTWGRQNGDPQWDSINTFDKNERAASTCLFYVLQTLQMLQFLLWASHGNM